MARVTVEDCVTKVSNRFDLIIKASQLSREINSGAYQEGTLKKKEKSPVSALREIAAGTVDPDDLGERLETSMLSIDEDGEEFVAEAKKSIERSKSVSGEIIESKVASKVVEEKAVSPDSVEDIIEGEGEEDGLAEMYGDDDFGDIDEIADDVDDIKPMKRSNIVTNELEGRDDSYSSSFDDVATDGDSNKKTNDSKKGSKSSA